MATETIDPLARPVTPSEPLAVAVRIGWFLVWAFLTVLAWFVVVTHGFVNGSALDTVALTATAIVAFILPDMTFLVGLGQEVRPGYLPTRAVPFYNAMHRFWPPLVITALVGALLDPLAPAALAAFVGGLSWMAHVAMDRAAGYGLRNPDGSR